MDDEFNPFKEEILKINRHQSDDVQQLQVKIDNLLKENLDLKKKYEGLKNYNENVSKFGKQEHEPELSVKKFPFPVFNPNAIPRKFNKKEPNVDLYLEIIHIIDNLDRSLMVQETEHTKGLIDGVKMIKNQLLRLLHEREVELYHPLGELFNPKFHEAVGTCVHQDIQSGHIAFVKELGYKLHGETLRIAKVIVVQ